MCALANDISKAEEEGEGTYIDEGSIGVAGCVGSQVDCSHSSFLAPRSQTSHQYRGGMRQRETVKRTHFPGLFKG